MGDWARGITVGVIATIDFAVLSWLDTPSSVWVVLGVLAALAVASAGAFTLVER